MDTVRRCERARRAILCGITAGGQSDKGFAEKRRASPAGTNNTTPIAAILGILGGMALVDIAAFVYQKRDNKPIIRTVQVVKMNPVSRQFSKDLSVSGRSIFLSDSRLTYTLD